MFPFSNKNDFAVDCLMEFLHNTLPARLSLGRIETSFSLLVLNSERKQMRGQASN